MYVIWSFYKNVIFNFISYYSNDGKKSVIIWTIMIIPYPVADGNCG
jgi:hypothetical protein